MANKRKTSKAKPETKAVPDGEWSGDLPVPDGVPFVGMIRENRAITASGFPAKPPSGWFDDPRLRVLTPLTIDADGRVYGHIASWKQAHIGLAGSVKAPKSKSGYAYFRTGVVETSERSMVEVGQITLVGGHAPLSTDPSQTVAHYDNTDSAVIDVAVGEDRAGIWVAGSVRPDVDDVRLRTLRASSVSGDWRPVNGGLELVAVCACNVPGFPIPRTRVASGAPMALVAAGTAELAELAVEAATAEAEVVAEAVDATVPETAVEELEAIFADASADIMPDEKRLLTERVDRLERQLVGEAQERRQKLDAAILAAAAELSVEAIERAEQHAEQTGRSQDAISEVRERNKKLSSLRGRVASGSGDGDVDGDVEPAEDMVASLQSRVRDRKADVLRKRVSGD